MRRAGLTALLLDFDIGFPWPLTVILSGWTRSAGAALVGGSAFV